MPLFRSRLVVSAEPTEGGGWLIRLPTGDVTLTDAEFQDQFQAKGALLMWDGDHANAPYGRLYDADGYEINLPVVMTDLESGEVWYQADPAAHDFSPRRTVRAAPLEFRPHPPAVVNAIEAARNPAFRHPSSFTPPPGYERNVRPVEYGHLVEENTITLRTTPRRLIPLQPFTVTRPFTVTPEQRERMQAAINESLRIASGIVARAGRAWADVIEPQILDIPLPISQPDFDFRVHPRNPDIDDLERRIRDHLGLSPQEGTPAENDDEPRG